MSCGFRGHRPHTSESEHPFYREAGPWGWREKWMGYGRHQGHGSDEEGFGGFGVRRPLRFLAHKLELDEKQVAEMARILDELKTERAQAAVDDRRTLSEFADAIAAEVFDAGKAASGVSRRAASGQKLQDTVLRALQQIHACLNPEQRGRLAYMIRSGALQM